MKSTQSYTATFPFADSPFFEQRKNETPLAGLLQAQAVEFAQNGYLIFDPNIPAGTIDKATESLMPRFFDGDGKVKAARLTDAWRYCPAVQHIAAAPEVLAVLQALYGRTAIPFQTLNFPVGTEQRTHSDTIHFHTFPPRFMCGVWVALEDVDADNGPLHYYPQSHTLPIFEMYQTGRAGSLGGSSVNGEHYGHYENFVEAFLVAQKLERKELYLKKGQALIWAANLFHGGSPIRDKRRTRHSQVTHYYFEDCIYYAPLYSDPHLGKFTFKEVTDVRTGKVVPSMYNGRTLSGFSDWWTRFKNVVRRFKHR